MTKTRELAHMIPSYADAALIYSQNNRKYFTGFVSSLGYLLVTKRDTYLFVYFRYAEAARAVAKNCKVVQFRKFNDSLKEIIEKDRNRNDDKRNLMEDRRNVEGDMRRAFNEIVLNNG